jgi:transposase
MKPSWMSDARQIPDEVMTFLRQIAVCAIKEKNFHLDDVSEMLGISRSSIYDWLHRFAVDGYEGLETRQAPGAPPLITEEMDQWLCDTVLIKTPEAFEYNTPLWTSDILAELLERHFGVVVGGPAVNRHLKELGLSYQTPHYYAIEQNPEQLKAFTEEKFQKIQSFAEKVGAETCFEDEAGIDLRERSGKTWGATGCPPKVAVTGKRGRYNVLSAVSPQGSLHYWITDQNITAIVFIFFLQQLIKVYQRPIFLIVDRARYHTSRMVREFIWHHRRQIRIFYLPSYSPEINPDEHVWEEIKDKKLGRATIISKLHLKIKLQTALQALQQNVDRVTSFFYLPDTLYAAS